MKKSCCFLDQKYKCVCFIVHYTGLILNKNNTTQSTNQNTTSLNKKRQHKAHTTKHIIQEERDQNTRVPSMMRDNSVQPRSFQKEKEYLHFHVIITQTSYNFVHDTQNLFIITKQTQQTNKFTWLPLGYAGPSNDERQQRRSQWASYRNKNTVFSFSCLYHISHMTCQKYSGKKPMRCRP